MASLSPQSAGSMVQSVASRLKGQGDVPSSVLLLGGKNDCSWELTREPA